MVKKNVFHLQTVLDYREKLEENARVQVAELERAVQLEEEKLESLRKRQAESMRKLKRLQQAGPLDLRLIGQEVRFIQVIDRRIESQLESLSSLRAALEGHREELISAVKDKKQMEKLKEASDVRFKVEMNLAESRAVDELTTIQFNRRRQTAG